MNVSMNIKNMLEAGVHFGHQTRFWHPKMSPYIFGSKNKIHIINLEKTLVMYGQAMNFVKKIVSENGTILIVGTKRSAKKAVSESSIDCGMPYVNQRWLGGMLTNFKTIKSSVNRFKEMIVSRDAGYLDKLNTKQQYIFMHKFKKLEKSIGGFRDLQNLPDAIFVIDVGYHKIMIAEAKKLSIPVIGVVDTNHNPENVDYVIPGNDDSEKSAFLYMQHIAQNIKQARYSTVHEN